MQSFNLKPAMASRPSIRTRAPDTNLKVVAILEKANAIRQVSLSFSLQSLSACFRLSLLYNENGYLLQAFAGSDEDDDDSWSE